MNRRGLIAAGLCALALPAAPALAKDGMVDTVQILKSKRQLDLLGGGRVLKSYDIRLGKAPVGAKRFEGDNRTPEGAYRISGRIRNSAFHLSLGVDYPSRQDLAHAARWGRSPGGNICLHGQVNGQKITRADDWTAGCVALSNADMEEIYRTVPVGCVIRFYA